METETAARPIEAPILIAIGGFVHNQSGVFCLKCGGTSFVKMLARIPEANMTREHAH